YRDLVRKYSDSDRRNGSSDTANAQTVLVTTCDAAGCLESVSVSVGTGAALLALHGDGGGYLLLRQTNQRCALRLAAGGPKDKTKGGSYAYRIRATYRAKR